MFNEKIITSIINDEYRRINDFSYFVNNYINRIDPIRGLDVVDLYDHQKEIVNHIDSKKGILVIGKPRQCGISSLIIWKIVQEVILGNKTRIGIVSCNKNMVSLYAIEIIRLLNNLSYITSYNKEKIICNNVEIVFSTPHEKFFIGRGFDLLILDEFSFYGNEEIFKASICCMKIQSNLIIITGNYNRKSLVGEILEMASKHGKLYYNWYDINSDEYILNVAKMRKILGKEKFEMEYEMGV